MSSNANSSFQTLKAFFLNCSITPQREASHTQLLMNRVSGVLEAEGVSVKHVYMRDHTVAVGMFADGAEIGETDEWPEIQAHIMDADILVLGTPIWLGVKSSLATLAIERMYASSGTQNEKGQYAYYGKTGGCIITGNEDGIKHCSMDILYALQHIGYTIPPQADCGWIGEAGPGPSYGDTKWKGETLAAPAGYENEFTNRNATFMAWNLMHMAALLKENGGIPAQGNVADDWLQVTNAKNMNPNTGKK